MRSPLGPSKLALALCLFVPALSVHAAEVAVNCSKKSLAGEIDKLNKLTANTVQISGNCVEDILVDGHANLTLVGSGGASITATNLESATALFVNNSQVTIETLTLNGGFQGAFCDNRSTCVLRDMTIQGGFNGLGAQGQSAVDIVGVSTIASTTIPRVGTGIGVYGASAVNIRPKWSNGYDPLEAGPVISGYDAGALVQDGSFLRTDNVVISDNNTGVFAQRDATLKILVGSYETDPDVFEFGPGGISNNVDQGVWLRSTSSAQIGGPIFDNGTGIQVGPLALFHNAGVELSDNTTDVSCTHTTAVSIPPVFCTPPSP